MLLKEVCMAKGWFLFFFFLNFKKTSHQDR